MLNDATVIVAVEDCGIGLTDDQLPRMFEPFYTTKADGMGLGLAICQTIVSAHDGTVTVVRNAARGTTFSFGLPALAREPLVHDAAVASN
jgi:signal transduction histidine kinase